MLNSEKIIEGIRDDAPVVYDILHEQLYPAIRSKYPQSGTDYTWEDYFKIFSDHTPPTADQLLEALSEYSGDNWDVHYWSGRYAQMIEHDNQNNTPIRVPLTESDLYDLLSGEVTFHWSFSGVNLFLFNTDSTPQFDPDSDEYDPTLTV